MPLCPALPSEGFFADTVRHVPVTSRVFMSWSQLLSKSFQGTLLFVLSHFLLDFFFFFCTQLYCTTLNTTLELSLWENVA